MFSVSSEKGVSVKGPFPRIWTDATRVELRKTTSYSDLLVGFATQPGIITIYLTYLYEL